MLILENIKKQQLQARKDKDIIKTSILTCLVSDITMIGKNDGNRASNDVDAISVIKKYINSINESIEILNRNLEVTNPKLSEGQANGFKELYKDELDKSNIELEIVKMFLPPQLSEEELSIIIKDIIASNNLTLPKGKGVIMKILKEKYAGKYDSSLAIKIIDTL